MGYSVFHLEYEKGGWARSHYRDHINNTVADQLRVFGGQPNLYQAKV